MKVILWGVLFGFTFKLAIDVAKKVRNRKK